MTSLTDLIPGSYTVDPTHSEVGFIARHAMVTKVRGRFHDVDGTITVADSLQDSTAVATIKTRSVDTGNADRDLHLQSADFFNTATNPTITFTSTAVRPDESGFVLDGDLTINAITRPVSLDVEFDGMATDPFGNVRIGFSATTAVDREEWGLTWNAALETGGFLVSKKIILQLEISAIRQG